MQFHSQRREVIQLRWVRSLSEATDRAITFTFTSLLIVLLYFRFFPVFAEAGIGQISPITCLSAIIILMKAGSVLRLLFLQAVLANFGGFTFQGDDGEEYYIDEVTDEERVQLEANGCDVDCAEMCWYLSDGDKFIGCVDFCGCEKLIEEVHAERSGPPKGPDEGIQLGDIAERGGRGRGRGRGRGKGKGQGEGEGQGHGEGQGEGQGNIPIPPPPPPSTELLTTDLSPAYRSGDCSFDCSQICADAPDTCFDQCQEQFCAGLMLWEYLGIAVFLAAAIIGAVYAVLTLHSAAKLDFLLDDSVHRH